MPMQIEDGDDGQRPKKMLINFLFIVIVETDLTYTLDHPDLERAPLLLVGAVLWSY